MRLLSVQTVCFVLNSHQKFSLSDYVSAVVVQTINHKALVNGGVDTTEDYRKADILENVQDDDSDGSSNGTDHDFGQERWRPLNDVFNTQFKNSVHPETLPLRVALSHNRMHCTSRCAFYNCTLKP